VFFADRRHFPRVDCPTSAPYQPAIDSEAVFIRVELSRSVSALAPHSAFVVALIARLSALSGAAPTGSHSCVSPA